MSVLRDMLLLQTEWFAALYDRCLLLPFYASARLADDEFGSLGNAYAFKWVGAGFINPGLDCACALKGLRWAITSCYMGDAVLNLMVIPCL